MQAALWRNRIGKFTINKNKFNHKTIRMKKIFLTLSVACALAVSVLKAQIVGITDFTFDSCYSASTIGIVHYNMSNDSIIAGCANEFGFIIGDNEVITCGTRIVNMGQHDKSFQGQGYFDTCHGHIHLPDMVQLYITNACGNVIAVGNKLGFNMQDGANFVNWMYNGGNSCDLTWLSRYGYVDPALALTASNPDFNGSDRMGLSAGFYDTYGPQTWGNGIVSNNIGIPNGSYYMCVAGHFNQYMNQGINIFPDTLSIPFTISGTYPPVASSPRVVTVGGQVVMQSPQAVGAVSASNTSNTSDVTVSWNDANTPCGYKVTPVIIKGQTAQSLTNISISTSAKSLQFPYAVLHNANLSLGINGAAKYRFDVRAINGTQESSPVRSIQSVNIK